MLFPTTFLSLASSGYYCISPSPLVSSHPGTVQSPCPGNTEMLLILSGREDLAWR